MTTESRREVPPADAGLLNVRLDDVPGNGAPVRTKNPSGAEVSPIVERLRLVLALCLLGVGFALAIFGWSRGDDHFYHLGLTLGPAGLVVLVFEYLVRISLDTRHVQEMMKLDRRHAEELGGIREETIGRLQGITKDLREIVTFDLDKGKLGLVGIYANRADAVRLAIAPMIEAEKEGIYLVGSTSFGLRCEVTNGPGHSTQTPDALLKRIAEKKRDGFDIRILLTAPEKVVERHAQEAALRSAERGTIASELRNACHTLQRNGLADCTRLYKGSPTCFTVVFKGQRRMLVNPYPYQGEAYKSWAIMIEHRVDGIYEPFLQSHVLDPWDNKELAKPLTDNIVNELQSAEKAEKGFAEQAERRKSEQVKEIEMELKNLPHETEAQP